jgi:signal peptidase I
MPDDNDINNTNTTTEDTKTNTKLALREVIITFLIALVVFLGMHSTLQNSEVISGSMLPTLGIGERLFVYKLAYKFGHDPQRGDIIVFTPPEQLSSEWDYIKRVIGLPGETVEIHGGEVYIYKTDGTVLQLDEPYIADSPNYTYSSGVIPEASYVVLGDNRNNSGDSHDGNWMVTRSEIVGRAWLVIWPLSEFGSAPNYGDYEEN